MNSFCGVLAIVGESNVGKSQLLNALLQAPLAVVHHKRNLTRERMRAVITQGERQLVIEDTAGLAGLVAPSAAAMARYRHSHSHSHSHSQKKKSSNATPSSQRAGGRDYWARRMREEALNAARSADIVLWVVDAARGEKSLPSAISLAQQAGGEDEVAVDLQTTDESLGNSREGNSRKGNSREKNLCKRLRARSFFALNKIDLLRDKRQLLPLAALVEQAQCCSEVFMLSAKKGDGIDRARESLMQALPPAPFLYENDGDTREHEVIACEITRSVIYDRLHEELPYDAQVKNELTEKGEDGSLHFAQCLHLRRESQRRILLAHEGKLLRLLQQQSEHALQKHFSCAVRLSLHVPRARDW